MEHPYPEIIEELLDHMDKLDYELFDGHLVSTENNSQKLNKMIQAQITMSKALILLLRRR